LVVTGVMADKDHLYMAKCIGQIASEVICITPENPRALKGSDYAAEFRSLGTPASEAESPLEAMKIAIDKARKESKAILCVGSLYMYGQIIDALNHLR